MSMDLARTLIERPLARETKNQQEKSPVDLFPHGIILCPGFVKELDGLIDVHVHLLICILITCSTLFLKSLKTVSKW